nr:serine/threonine-protein kinase atm [Quercus suber]
MLKYWSWQSLKSVNLTACMGSSCQTRVHFKNLNHDMLTANGISFGCLLSIVSHILSLASFASDPPFPIFSGDTIVHVVQKVVDGFLEMEDNHVTAGVVDKINIFSPR